MSESLATPYYAVIFTSRKSNNLAKYAETNERMVALSKDQPGFLRIVHAITDTGESVTTCYWRDMESISHWKKNVEHREAQQHGIEKWYDSYEIEIARIDRAYRWVRDE